MSAKTDNIKTPKKQRSKSVPTKKKTDIAAGKKTDMCSRSKVLRKIIECLENKQYRHMLNWYGESKEEFIVKFVHMNNPESKNADYLELFKELDRLSNKYEKYKQEEKYDQYCKIRCKSNLRKLVESNALELVEKTKKGKSIELRRYRLISDVSSVKSAVLKDEKMITRCNVINIYVNVPFGGAIISSISPVGPPLLDTCCTTENRNEDSGNVGRQKEFFALYEHEKQMDENNNALHAMSAEDTGLCSSSTSRSGIEENDKSEMMECCQQLDKKPQGTVEIQNNGAVPTNYGGSLNMESVGKLIFPSCTNPIEEAMKAINIANTDCVPFGYTESQYSNNSPNRFQNEGCQNMDGDVIDVSHLVPSSPQNCEIFNNDPLFQMWDSCSLDADKPLQQDNDPFLSQAVSHRLDDNAFKNFEHLVTDNEELFSFENFDAVQ